MARIACLVLLVLLTLALGLIYVFANIAGLAGSDTCGGCDPRNGWTTAASVVFFTSLGITIGYAAWLLHQGIRSRRDARRGDVST